MTFGDGQILDKNTGIVYKPIKPGDYDLLASQGMVFKLEIDEIVRGHKFYTLLHVRPSDYNITYKQTEKWPKAQLMWGHEFLKEGDKNRKYLNIVNPLSVPQKFYNKGSVQWFRLYEKPSKKLKPETKKHLGDILDNL